MQGPPPPEPDPCPAAGVPGAPALLPPAPTTPRGSRCPQWDKHPLPQDTVAFLPTTSATKAIALCHCDTSRQAHDPATAPPEVQPRGDPGPRCLQPPVPSHRKSVDSRPASRMGSVHSGLSPCHAEAWYTAPGCLTPPKHAAERTQAATSSCVSTVPFTCKVQNRQVHGDGRQQRCRGLEGGAG